MDLKILHLHLLIEKSVVEVLATVQALERRFLTVRLLGQSQGRNQQLEIKIETDGGIQREEKVIEKMVTGLLEGLAVKEKSGNEVGAREILPARYVGTLLNTVSRSHRALHMPSTHPPLLFFPFP